MDLKVERLVLRVMFIGFLELHHWNMNDFYGTDQACIHTCGMFMWVYIYVCIHFYLYTPHVQFPSFQKCYSTIAPQYSRYLGSYIQLDLRHMWVKHLKSSALESCSLNKDFWASVGEIPTSMTERNTTGLRACSAAPAPHHPTSSHRTAMMPAVWETKRQVKGVLVWQKPNNLMKPAISQLWPKKCKHSCRHGKYQLNQKTIG